MASDTLLHKLLIESASRHPDKPAVSFGDDQLTYGQLEDASNRVCRVLLDGGVKPGDRVGIYLKKSAEAVVALHGALKAGAAYVPLDPDSPAPRLAYIIRDCGIRCLVTSGDKMAFLTSAGEDLSSLETVLLLAGEGVELPAAIRSVTKNDIDSAPAAPRSVPRGEDDLAYILYTSGSTGAPKGVMISHRTSLTFVNWAGGAVGVTGSDTLSNHAPLHFDLSIFDIFCSMKAGGLLIMVPPILSTFPYRLAEWMDTNRISVWYSVPSILSTLARQGEMTRFAYEALRAVIFAGEVFPTKYLRELMNVLPRPRYFNFFGPTETNVITYHVVPPLDPDQIEPIPIGKPCEGYRVYALDQSGGIITEPGKTGELYAAGPCVAQGYWGDEEKTKKGFIPDPVDPDSGIMAHRTGDFVSLDDNGDFLFAGRRDHMIKSRGYRIEIGEIESMLYSHADVRDAVVVAIPDEHIGNRIMAVVVPKGDQPLDAVDLQEYCMERIPNYMVPEVIEFRDNIPKTSTGKFDRQAVTADFSSR